MKDTRSPKQLCSKPFAVGRFIVHFLVLIALYFLPEVFTFKLLKPGEYYGLIFGVIWSVLLASIIMLLPRKAGRIAFGITYYFILLWALAQSGYYAVFDKMMWLSTIQYAGEGAAFLGDVLGSFRPVWWIGATVLIALGILMIWKYPKPFARFCLRTPLFGVVAVCIAALCAFPQIIFQRDNDIWGTHSEYAQSSSYRARYTTMFDAKSTYDICGIYQLTLRDIWMHELYPLTPAYRAAQEKELQEIDTYFSQRGEHSDNEMTGIFAGKNVVLVLMESMDDWMITPEDTPTLCKLMDEGINFTDFYTPGYGSARTLNSEFCINTGIYLPTTGSYVFDYVTNHFNQSFASQMTGNGYSAQVYHYNSPNFYSRGVFEPAMGYEKYICYADYVDDEELLYNENLLFDVPELNEQFFRDMPTFNTIITRSAHLSYVYNEVLSYRALKQYPEYRGLYGSEEEDCARVKAKLVDDMFARLLAELEAHGQLENTVIIGVTDHYTYGYKNLDELFLHSGVQNDLLLEKTPCFVWSYGGPSIEVSKTLNTSDFLPTMLNLLGIDSPYRYLGQDAFDPNYTGFAYFPDGSWISDGVAYRALSGNEHQILYNTNEKALDDTFLMQTTDAVLSYIRISNLLLTSDYYKSIH